MRGIVHGGSPISFAIEEHRTDLCIVGGGLAGICAAVEAARHGIPVVLMQDRPMLGGNSSSEIRMWVSGSHGKNNRETGILDELQQENHFRNPEKNYSLWDGILYALVKAEQNIELLLNCSCIDCVMDGSRIVSVTGWQMSTQSYHKVHARVFADCSGDSILAPLTGAIYRHGREACGEFNESIAPAEADSKTMGLSLLLQARETSHPVPFIAPKWANHYGREDLPGRVPDLSDIRENFWYMELGGEQNTIADSESIRDELLKVAYGVWDYVKNDPENHKRNQNWSLDWMGFLPGRRESRRYVGDHVMTQNDVSAGGDFPDTIAYGGWTMDDHDPGGISTKRPPNIFHPAPSPYGIAYRCLYSINIDNLMFAGRNISATHAAMSSTRVMATCALLGQAVGAAASIALAENIPPREVGKSHIAHLQQILLEDDCYLPGIRRRVPDCTVYAELVCQAENAENLRDGWDRPIGDKDHGCYVLPGQSVEYAFHEERKISRVRIVFDSDLNYDTLPEEERILQRSMFHNKPLGLALSHVPKTMVRSFYVEALLKDGSSCILFSTDCQIKRLFILDVFCQCTGIRLVLNSTWGAALCHIFSFDVDTHGG